MQTIEKFVKINLVTGIYEFVNAANTVDGDIVVSNDRFVIDGKSLLGVISIDPSQGMKVKYPAEAKDFDKLIEQWVE